MKRQDLQKLHLSGKILLLGDNMTIPFLYEIILYCLYKLNGERSTSSIYHLLNGKKSSQTLQDMHLFGLTPIFKTYDPFSRVELKMAVEHLEKYDFIAQASQQHYQITKKGLERAESLFSRFSFLNLLNGWEFQSAGVFWERLSLLVQVVSNLTHYVSKYVPVQKNSEAHLWVKEFLRECQIGRTELGRKLYKELESTLENNPHIDPAVVILRFTGSHSIGLTSRQASKKLDMEETLYRFQFLTLIHYLMGTSKENPNEFPILYEVLGHLHDPVPLTSSTKATMNLLEKGFSIEEIAASRSLKVSTIQDHIVELALNFKNFDISPYVDNEKERAIISAAKKASSRQLKHIRSLLEDVEYFEIRLVMAKYGDES